MCSAPKEREMCSLPRGASNENLQRNTLLCTQLTPRAFINSNYSVMKIRQGLHLIRKLRSPFLPLQQVFFMFGECNSCILHELKQQPSGPSGFPLLLADFISFPLLGHFCIFSLSPPQSYFYNFFSFPFFVPQFINIIILVFFFFMSLLWSLTFIFCLLLFNHSYFLSCSSSLSHFAHPLLPLLPPSSPPPFVSANLFSLINSILSTNYHIPKNSGFLFALPSGTELRMHPLRWAPVPDLHPPSAPPASASPLPSHLLCLSRT